MTPKLKAEELVQKMWECNRNTLDAIQCALIAVDEMLIHVDMVDDDAAINYWKQVKQEIENI